MTRVLPINNNPDNFFSEAENFWNLNKLYSDLACAKRNSLTRREKEFLRGLLCGYTPVEICAKVNVNANSLRVSLSRGLYRYIEKLLSENCEKFVKVNATRIPHLLAEAGYKLQSSVPITSNPPKIAFIPPAKKRQDWGEMIDTDRFYGRTQEIQQLQQWILTDQSRIVAILGIGGLGKTVLAAKLAQEIQGEFDYLIWRSLRSDPSISELVINLIQFLSQQPLNLEELSSLNLETLISQLLEYLRENRCLIIFDKAESIRINYDDFHELLRRIGEERHHSCLLLTSRENPKEIISLTGKKRPVQTLQLSGLSQTEAREMLGASGDFIGTENEWTELIDRYSGHPFALKLAASKIQHKYHHKISAFLNQESGLFPELCELLKQQFDLMSNLERKVLYWLIVKPDPTFRCAITESVLPFGTEQQFSYALELLRERSLITKHTTEFSQPLILSKYVTKRLVEQIFR
ncbi:MAG: NB-ARC domain-containing protein [Phormidium sp.]